MNKIDKLIAALKRDSPAFITYTDAEGTTQRVPIGEFCCHVGLSTDAYSIPQGDIPRVIEQVEALNESDYGILKEIIVWILSARMEAGLQCPSG